MRLEVEKLQAEKEERAQRVGNSTPIIKRRSNFYERLADYDKVVEVGFSVLDENARRIAEEQKVSRSAFKEYILASNALEPTEADDAIIEIISPVLKKGNYKWRGIYNGDIISFRMKSAEFRTLIQTGSVEFKNGTTIRCAIEIEKQIGSNGEEEITNINVIRVNEYFDRDKPTETPEGKHHRQKVAAAKNQLSIFDPPK